MPTIRREAAPGRDGVRRWGRDSVFRPWLKPSPEAQTPTSPNSSETSNRARLTPEQIEQGLRSLRSRGSRSTRTTRCCTRPRRWSGRFCSWRSRKRRQRRSPLRKSRTTEHACRCHERHWHQGRRGRAPGANHRPAHSPAYFYLPVEGGIPQPESGLGQHVYKGRPVEPVRHGKPEDALASRSERHGVGDSGRWLQRFFSGPRAPWWCSALCARELRGHIGSVQQGQAPTQGGQAKDGDAPRGYAGAQARGGAG